MGLREVGEFGDSAALGRDEEDVVADYTEGRGVGLAGDGEVAVEDLGEAAFAGGGLGVGGVGFEDHHPYGGLVGGGDDGEIGHFDGWGLLLWLFWLWLFWLWGTEMQLWIASCFKDYAEVF